MAKTSDFEHMELRSGDTCTSNFSKLSCPVSCEGTVKKSPVQVIYLRRNAGVNRQIAPFLDLTQNSPPPHGNGATSTDNFLTDESYGSNEYTVQKLLVQVIPLWRYNTYTKHSLTPFFHVSRVCGSIGHKCTLDVPVGLPALRRVFQR